MIKIPIRNIVNQKFSVEILPENAIFNFDFLYNSRGQYFTIDLAIGNNEVMKGIRVVSGIPILSQFTFTTGDLIVLNSAEYNNDPILGAWDSACEMFYFEKSELDEAL